MAEKGNYWKNSNDALMGLDDLDPGKSIFGDSGSLPRPPPDFDMEKFDRGRVFFRRNIFVFTIALLFSLVFGMNLPELLEALVYTKKSDTPSKARYRYMMTFKHVAMWHYGNVWEVDSPAQKSILTVRHAHSKVRNEMEDELPRRGNHLYLSQRDMGVVQSGFIGMVVMYPDTFGLTYSKSDLEDYVYFWYGIGHILGIEKRFNICAHGYKQSVAFCEDIKNCILATSKPREFGRMTSALIEAFRLPFIPFQMVSFPMVASWVQKSKNADVTLADMFRRVFWKLLFTSVSVFAWLRLFLNAIVERVFRLKFQNVIN